MQQEPEHNIRVDTVVPGRDQLGDPVPPIDKGRCTKNPVAMFAFLITEDKRLHFLFWRVSQTLGFGVWRRGV